MSELLKVNPALSIVMNRIHTPKQTGIFYVYLHLDPESLHIRCVGKGKTKRYSDFCLKNRYGHHKSWIQSLKKRNLKPVAIKIVDNISESEAFEIEKEIISVLNNLTNLTKGGEGISGYSHTPETLTKISHTLFQKGEKPW